MINCGVIREGGLTSGLQHAIDRLKDPRFGNGSGSTLESELAGDADDFQTLYLYDTTGTRISFVYVNTFTGNCGTALFSNLHVVESFSNEKKLLMVKYMEDFARLTNHGWLLYGVSENQPLLTRLLVQREWTQLYKFKSPRTRVECTMFGKDLTK